MGLIEHFSPMPARAAAPHDRVRGLDWPHNNCRADSSLPRVDAGAAACRIPGSATMQWMTEKGAEPSRRLRSMKINLGQHSHSEGETLGNFPWAGLQNVTRASLVVAWPDAASLLSRVRGLQRALRERHPEAAADERCDGGLHPRRPS